MSAWIIEEASCGPGLRVAVKDLIDVAGWPTTAGCRAVAERAQPAAADAACLAGLRAAITRGEACLAGKTTLHELAYGISGINAAPLMIERCTTRAVMKPQNMYETAAMKAGSRHSPSVRANRYVATPARLNCNSTA